MYYNEFAIDQKPIFYTEQILMIYMLNFKDAEKMWLQSIDRLTNKILSNALDVVYCNNSKQNCSSLRHE